LPTVRVTVVVPTYNEAGNIESLIGSIRRTAPEAHVLVVDDASPDGTAAIVEQLAAADPRLAVLRRSAKEGLGSAYRAGFRRAIDAGAEVCVQMDADFSHDPSALPAMLSILHHGVDLAMGSRYIPGSVVENWPRGRRLLSRWGNRYAAGVLGLGVNDVTSGYRAYRVDALRRMDFESVTAQGYGFQVEMTARLVRLGGSVVEFPITFRDRTAGESKMSRSIIGEAFFLVAKLWVTDFAGRRARRRSGR
jgi:glycosyltransferase involved in cell wall biosynthesis